MHSPVVTSLQWAKKAGLLKRRMGSNLKEPSTELEEDEAIEKVEAEPETGKATSINEDSRILADFYISLHMFIFFCTFVMCKCIFCCMCFFVYILDFLHIELID